MADYCDRDDIEDIFGQSNVAKWADLDNDSPLIEGTLSTRTDDDTGIVTIASGHGVTTNDTIDVLWAAGKIYGMTVSASDSTTVTLDGGDGDALPVANASVSIRLSTKISARVARSIVDAMADVDRKMLGGPYTIPLATSAGAIPERIKQICAAIAGVWLYENRGVNDYDAKSKTAKHKLSFHQDRAYGEIAEYRSNQSRLDAVSIATSTPYAHDYHTEVKDDASLLND